MPLATGTRLGPYEVVATLGSGGMGEVYRARDTKLNRDVALKVLPDSFANDPERLARFQREAQVLALLNHPNIGGIYGLEDADGVRALVLELVEGPTLAEVIATGTTQAPAAAATSESARRGAAASGGGAPRALSVDEALPIARQVAEALEAAHEHGIIHRDLKPANVKLRPDGVVKVLDFGLAKALAPGAGSEAEDPAYVLSQSPTMSAAATRAGLILGTAAYMSPEQARGKPVDKRADIWAFGCVLYEMLTGKRAFAGDEVTDTLAFVITKEPDWRALLAGTPASIQRLLKRTLEKDRTKRLQHIGDARIEIDEALTVPPAETTPAASPTVVRPLSRWRCVAALAAGTLAVATFGGAVVWLTMRPSPPRVTRLTIASSAGATLTVSGNDRDLAITPDGSRVVYVGSNSTQIFVRALDQLEPTPLAGLGAPRGLFISPDGQWIGFGDGGTATLKKVAIVGGPAVTLCRLTGTPRGATWGPDGTIIFATNNPSVGLLRVSAAGGEPTMLSEPSRERGEADHLWPEFLPGGQAVLFTITPAQGGIDNAQVAVLDLQTGTQKILVRGGSHAHYVPSGHLVYAAAGTLRAIAFDPDRLEAVGTPIPVLPQVLTTVLGAADFDVAGDGTLVYVSGGAAGVMRTLVWIDRQGHEDAIKAPIRAYTYPRVSPDGTRIALDIRDQDSDIWIWDLAREALTRFTFEATQDRFPVWSPDGRRIVFSSNRAGSGSLFWQAADGTGTVERLTESKADQFPTAISSDNTRVLFDDNGTQDLMMLALDRERPPTRSAGSGSSVSTVERSTGSGRVQLLVQTPFFERNGEISPDGRWLAYESNESRQFEIYVRPFPDVNSGRWQVSTGGGTRPLWAPNGQELFYFSPTGALMSVRVQRGTAWTAGTPTKLFEGPYYRDPALYGRTYDVSPDGRQFLMIKPVGNAEQAAVSVNLIVVQNWFEELKRLVPTN